MCKIYTYNKIMSTSLDSSLISQPFFCQTEKFILKLNILLARVKGKHSCLIMWLILVFKYWITIKFVCHTFIGISSYKWPFLILIDESCLRETHNYYLIRLIWGSFEFCEECCRQIIWMGIVVALFLAKGVVQIKPGGI